MVLKIRGCVPMNIPTRMNQDCLVANFFLFEKRAVNRQCLSIVSANNNSFKVSERLYRNLRQILALLVSMKWAINIGACVRHHFDFANLKLCPHFVKFSGLFSAQVIADDRCWQSFIRHQTVFDCVAQIYNGVPSG